MAATLHQEVDIEELSTEFDLPVPDHLPTLESILREDESNENNDDDLSTVLELQTDIAESTSLCSFDSRARSRIKNRTLVEKHGPILRRSNLRGLSSQLVAANTSRVEAGFPTSLACSSQFIAIGTSKGVSLIFDNSQTMKWCLRLPQEEDVASLSALAISSDSRRLISGYSRGQIALWDLKTGTLLNLLRDIQLALFCVLHTKFTSIENVAIVSDSGGSMYQVVLRSGRRSMQASCIFSGSHGEVLTLAPLTSDGPINSALKPLMKMCVVAFATVTKLIVLSLHPRMSIIFTYPLKAEPSSCPLISWLVPDGSFPLIAFARGCLINIYQLSFGKESTLNFSFLKNIQLGYSLQTMNWINSSVIMLVDTQEQIHVMDCEVSEELETIDANDLQLVYGSAFFKGLATGGNVSEAMRMAGERSCYYSICPLMTIDGSLERMSSNGMSSNRVFVLGTRSVVVYSLRSWDDRIDWFVKQNKYPEAFSLSSSFYSGEGRAMIGLPLNPVDRRRVVAGKLVDLIKEFIDLGTTKLTPASGSVDALFDHYNHVIPVCVEHSLSIGSEGEALIDEMNTKFCNDYLSLSIFWECLQQHISNGRISKLNPEMTKNIVDYFEEQGRLVDLESMIVRLEISCLDIHQCMNICRKYNLIDGVIYLHNQAFCDYLSPLLEIYERIEEKVLKKEKLDDQDVDIGMKLLVYISCCLTGRGYPYGDIEGSERSRVRCEVITFITDWKSRSTSVQIPFANIRTLLYLDTSEFLNVLSLAFESDPNFDSDVNASKEQNQKVVDVLLQVMVPDSEFTSSQIGSLYMFLARQVSKKESAIHVSRSLLEEIIQFLTNCKDEKKAEDCQQALLELAQSGIVGGGIVGGGMVGGGIVGSGMVDGGLLDKMLDRSLDVGFYRVCEFIYWEKRAFDKMFVSILMDEPRKTHVFSRIEQIMSSNSDATPDEKRVFMKSVFERIKDLCRIDCQQVAKLLRQRLLHDHELKSILKTLETDQEILFKLLNCLLPDGLNYSSDLNGLNQSSNLNGPNQSSNLNGPNHSSDLNGPNQSSNLNGRFKCLTENAINEKFIELMCIYEPESVSTFLANCRSYRRTVALDHCQNYRVTEGAAFLLEQDERFLEAFDLRFNRFKQSTKPSYGPYFLNTEIESIELELNKLLQFCERASEKTIDDEDKQPLWFPLLENVQSLVQFGSNDEMKRKLNHLTDMVFNEMIRFVSLISILQWMLKDPKKAKLSDVKQLLMKAIDACNCEASLFKSTSRLLNADLHRQLDTLTTVSQKAIPSKSLSSCQKCRNPLKTRETDMVIFSCSHTYHSTCLDVEGVCPACDTSEARKEGRPNEGNPNEGKPNEGNPNEGNLNGNNGDISQPEPKEEEPDGDRILTLQREMLSRIRSAFISARMVASSQSHSRATNSFIQSQELKLSPEWTSYSTAMK